MKMDVTTEKNLILFGAYVEQQGFYWNAHSSGGRVYLAKHFPWKRESDKWIFEISTETRKFDNDVEAVFFVAKGHGYPVSVNKLVEKLKEFVEPSNFEFSFASDHPCEPVSYMY